MATQKRQGPAIILAFLAIIAVGVLLRQAFFAFYRAAYPVHYDGVVLEESEKHRLDPGFVFAVIRCESGFDHRAVSHVEARGLMQITWDTFEWARWRMGEDESLSFDEMFVPEVNIRYGAAILRLLLDEFESERVALAAYHAGWGSVKRWLADEKYSPDGVTLDHIPYGDTNAYVAKVLDTRETYRRLYQY